MWVLWVSGMIEALRAEGTEAGKAKSANNDDFAVPRGYERLHQNQLRLPQPMPVPAASGARDASRAAATDERGLCSSSGLRRTERCCGRRRDSTSGMEVARS